MTNIEKRKEILEKRLRLLNNYLLKEADEGVSLAEYMTSLRITPKMFFSELPSDFQTPIQDGKENVMVYTSALNDLYYNQYELFSEGMMNAEGDGGGPCGPNKCLHPTGICIRCNKGGNRIIRQTNVKMNCDGHSEDGGYKGGLVHEGDEFYASGCGLRPTAPLRRTNTEKNKKKWREYEAKKATWDKCKAAHKEKKDEKKEDRKAGKQKKGLHALNKFSPAFVLARNSFLALVGLNFRNLAGNIAKMESKSPKLWKKLSAKWFNLGGDVSALRNTANKAKDKKPLFGVKKSADGTSFAVTAEVALTSAAGILAAVAPIIRALKGETGEPLGDEVPPEIGGLGSDIPDEPDDDDAPTGFVWTKGYIVGAVAGSLVIVGLVAWGLGAFKGGK